MEWKPTAAVWNEVHLATASLGGRVSFAAPILSGHSEPKTQRATAPECICALAGLVVLLERRIMMLQGSRIKDAG